MVDTVARRRDSENNDVTGSAAVGAIGKWTEFKFRAKFLSQNKKKIQPGIDEMTLHWQDPNSLKT